MSTADAEIAVVAAEAGAAVVRANYGGRQTRIVKSATDFATQTDLDAEQAIVNVLLASCPEDAIRGEERGRVGASATSRQWLVDPLCGTLNFAAVTPLMTVNVALVDGNTVTAAASADPIAKETFWTDGLTAFARRGAIDHQLTPNDESRLVEINADRPRDAPSVSAKLVGDLDFRSQFSPRVISSTLGVVWVAAGRRAAYVSDGTFEDDLHFAAGLAIAAAAGCTITNFRGGPLNSGDGAVISASPMVHEPLLTLLRPHLTFRDV